jgi:hypothetical protein
MLLFIVPLSVGTAGFFSLPAVHSPRVSMSELDPSWIRWPYARIRRELVTEQGEVRRFVAQLEYDVAATPTGQSTPDWRTVARFDHDISGEQSHDVREEGLHMDIYRHGEKERVITDFPPVPLAIAPRFCEETLEARADALLERFEWWHDLHGPWRTHSSE